MSVDNEILFFNERDGPYFPVLKVLHKCTCSALRDASAPILMPTRGDLSGRGARADPDILPKLQVDRGAIEFVLKGANIMCPGLTSKGGRLVEGLPKDAVVVRPMRFNAPGDGLSELSLHRAPTVNRPSWRRARSTLSPSASCSWARTKCTERRCNCAVVPA